MGGPLRQRLACVLVDADKPAPTQNSKAPFSASGVVSGVDFKYPKIIQ
jgi:hypothetical protein